MNEEPGHTEVQSRVTPEPGGNAAAAQINEPPLGRAFLRVMRAVMFEETPHPDLDTLPLAQLRLLWTVFYNFDATMKEFSERLGVSQSTVTQLADRLVRRGLVERQTDAADRRVVRLHVSLLGRRILGEANARQRHTFEDVWNTIAADNRAVVMRGLEILGDAAEIVRADQGCEHLGWPERKASDVAQGEEASETSQPMVDLMARRVRGRTIR